MWPRLPRKLFQKWHTVRRWRVVSPTLRMRSVFLFLFRGPASEPWAQKSKPDIGGHHAGCLGQHRNYVSSRRKRRGKGSLKPPPPLSVTPDIYGPLRSPHHTRGTTNGTRLDVAQIDPIRGQAPPEGSTSDSLTMPGHDRWPDSLPAFSGVNWDAAGSILRDIDWPAH